MVNHALSGSGECDHGNALTTVFADFVREVIEANLDTIYYKISGPEQQ